MHNKRDQLYSQSDKSSCSTTTARFKFDERVVDVFSDMISRSVPGYQQILEMLPSLVKQINNDGYNNNHSDHNYYDLGCSLGAGMISIAEGLTENNILEKNKIIGIDNSSAMLKQAKHILNEVKKSNPGFNFELAERNIQQTSINNAAMVLMNFTLQFIPLAERDALISNIFSGLVNGGALILSEKIKFDDANTQQRLTNIHHQFKADQGYSQLEIAKKRDAIEDVLIPETLEVHQQRLHNVGFSIVTPWIQNLQFISILAIK